MDLKNIIKNNQSNIKNIIKLITKEENEDIEQEVYIKVWQKKDSYEEQGKFAGWIGTIAKNFSKDFLKSSYGKISKKSESDDFSILNIEDKRGTPDDYLLRKEREKRIIKAIDSLKPKLRKVIMMYEIYNFSYEEISKELNCPIGTVKSRLYNAKQELAAKLKDLF